VNEFLQLLAMNLALMCAMSCVPVQAARSELRLPPKPIVQLGYSMLPLNDRGWGVLRRTPTLVVLGKRGTGADDTIVIQAESHKISAPMSAPVQAVDPARPDRFQVVKSERTGDERPTCMRYYMLTEDRAPARRNGGTGPMMLEAMYLTCVHPDDEGVGISLAYSHRYEPGQRDSAFDIKAAELLKGVKFASPGRLAKGDDHVR
jgi:hypothetical protein